MLMNYVSGNKFVVAMQVTVEDENTLVIRSNGKRKREDGEEEGCKYLRLERRAPQKLSRKFRLPENANVGAISAKCENGVLTVVVEKLPPPPKPKTVEVSISWSRLTLACLWFAVILGFWALGFRFLVALLRRFLCFEWLLPFRECWFVLLYTTKSWLLRVQKQQVLCMSRFCLLVWNVWIVNNTARLVLKKDLMGNHFLYGK